MASHSSRPPSSPADGAMTFLQIEDAAPLQIGPGCIRRDLPTAQGVRVWVVEMEPGAQWPMVDHHEAGEDFLVLHGEVIEGDHRFGPGTYVSFGPHTSHQPHTLSGVRLIGINAPRP